MTSYGCFCPADHNMNQTTNYKPNLYCNNCHSYPSQTKTGYYECRTCNFDICDNCFESKK